MVYATTRDLVVHYLHCLAIPNGVLAQPQFKPKLSGAFSPDCNILVVNVNRWVIFTMGFNFVHAYDCS